MQAFSLSNKREQQRDAVLSKNLAGISHIQWPSTKVVGVHTAAVDEGRRGAGYIEGMAFRHALPH